MVGNRAVVMELQAMVSRAAYNPGAGGGAPPVRSAAGVSRERFTQLTHVLAKALPACGQLGVCHVYCTVVRGASFKEPAADLPMAIAIAASLLDAPLPPRLAAVGEVDLAGRLRGVGSLEARLLEVAALGCCERVLVPAVEGVKKLACDARLASLELVPCATLRDALVHAIGTVVDKPPERRRRRRQPGGGDMGDDGDGGGMGGDGDGGDDLGFTGSGGRGLWSSEWAAGR
mmetsp:Transcript_38060/g.112712  ORF Transcript_38060/g.112712 Transcript_38060/m.112712 type:complete len:231 (-) Transcript_38060:714-1406(-)